MRHTYDSQKKYPEKSILYPAVYILYNLPNTRGIPISAAHLVPGFWFRE